jgi:hypothetical protein
MTSRTALQHLPKPELIARLVSAAAAAGVHTTPADLANAAKPRLARTLNYLEPQPQRTR